VSSTRLQVKVHGEKSYWRSVAVNIFVLTLLFMRAAHARLLRFRTSWRSAKFVLFHISLLPYLGRFVHGRVYVCSGAFGLWLDDCLYRGRTASCDTFDSLSLTEPHDFIIDCLEVWSFQWSSSSACLGAACVAMFFVRFGQ